MENLPDISNYIAAIDLGSRKLCGVIAHKGNDNKIHIVAKEIIPIDGTPIFKKGIVEDKTTLEFKIKTTIEKLQNTANVRVKKCYIGTSYNSSKQTDWNLKEVTDYIHKNIGCELINNTNYVESLCDIVLTDEEKSVGTLLIDFGHTTTTFALYNDSNLVTKNVLLYGSENTTADIESLNVSKTDAEKIKINIGIVDKKTSANKKCKIDNKIYDLYKLSDVIEQRVLDLITPVTETLSKRNWFKDTKHSIVICGGGSLLKNIDKTLEKELKCRVRKASVENIFYDNVAAQDLINISFLSLAALVYSAEDGCCSKFDAPRHTKKRGRIKIGTFLGNMFTEPNEERYTDN